MAIHHWYLVKSNKHNRIFLSVPLYNGNLRSPTVYCSDAQINNYYTKRQFQTRMGHSQAKSDSSLANNNSYLAKFSLQVITYRVSTTYWCHDDNVMIKRIFGWWILSSSTG